MLPGTGYYKALNCPFHEMGFCERPYCHFKHAKKQEFTQEASVQQEASTAKAAKQDTAPPVTIKKEPIETAVTAVEPPGVSNIVSGTIAQAALIAAGPSLEQLVQEAVKKVLLGGAADTSKLLGDIDTSSILAQLNIKKEKPDDDDDSDCVIEDEIPAKIVYDKSKVKSEKVEPSPPPEVPTTLTKPKLYLPPENCPAYNPTPIKDLEKRAENVHLDKPSSNYRPSIVEKPTNISRSLIQASSIHSKKSMAVPKASSSKPKFSYTPSKESVLGDLGDLSDSDNETSETPDLLGNILKAGNKSGVLTGGVVSEFEERVISERLKLIRKKNDKLDQCDKITSSSPTQDQTEKESDERNEIATKEVPPEETEEEKAERKIKEKEQEIQKLEEKRLLLENYYKAKLEEKKKRETQMEDSQKLKESRKDDKQKHSSRDQKGVKGAKDKKGTREKEQDKKERERHKDKKHDHQRSREKDRSKDKKKSEEISKDKKSSKSASDLEKENSDSRGRKRHRSSNHKSKRESSGSDSSDYDDSSSPNDTESDSSAVRSTSRKQKSRSKSKHHKHRKSSKHKTRDRSRSRQRSGKHKKKSRRRSSSESTSDESSRSRSKHKSKKSKTDYVRSAEDKIESAKADLDSQMHEVPRPQDLIAVQIKSEPSSPIVDEPTNSIAVSGDNMTDATNVFKSAEEELKKLLEGRRSLENSEPQSIQPPAEQPQLKVKCMGQLMARNTEETFTSPALDHDVFENVADMVHGYTEDSHDDCINENQNHEDSEGDFEPETGKTFMSAMNELEGSPTPTAQSKKDKEVKYKQDKSSSSSHHKSSSSNKTTSSRHKSSSSHRPSSSHKSSSSNKSSSSHHKSSSDHKSSSSHHKSSSSKPKSSSSHHKSSSSHSKSKKRDRSKDREQSKDKHEDKSEHKSFEDKSMSKKMRADEELFDSLVKKQVSVEHNNEDEFNRDEDSRSPLPDFSEELALLPDDISAEMISSHDIGEDYDNVADGLEDIFAGVDGEDDDELQRIFEQYSPQVNIEDPSLRKQKQLEEKVRSSLQEGSTLVSGKKRLAYQASEDQAKERRPLHMKKPAIRTPAQAMFDRYKKLQEMKQQQLIEKRMTEITEDNPDEGTVPGPSTSDTDFSMPQAPKKSRVAHKGGGLPPVVLSKTKQQLLARQKAKEVLSKSKENTTTAVTNAKGTTRKAHTPTTVHITRPMVTPDPKSKVPTNIRQRYLNSIIDECIKITAGEELEAFTRAEKEEADCCRKASSRMIYLNLVVNCIKKLRTEATEAAKASSKKSLNTGSSPTKRNLLTTHMQVLAGKPGSIGSWSIEKPTQLTTDDIDESLLYAVMKKYAMTEEQLVENGYPREDPEDPGKVKMKIEIRKKIDPEKARIVAADENKRLCDRCSVVYRVDEEGMQVVKEDCVHHWGRLFRRRMNRVTGPMSLWNCCDGSAESDGCQVAKAHVPNTLDYNNMRGFVSTIEKNGSGRVFALDCEMCNTTKGNELTRVTVIDNTGETCYESLVKPDTPIVDYNTRFSGITAQDMEGVNTTLREVQTHLLLKFEAKDILIGHSLESDLKALKLLHSTVVDTSVVFPHKMGPPFKRALKTLAAEQIQRIIQNGVDGHDSKEDALACLDLMKQKVTADVSKLQTQARANSSKRRDTYLTDPDSVKLN